MQCLASLLFCEQAFSWPGCNLKTSTLASPSPSYSLYIKRPWQATIAEGAIGGAFDAVVVVLFGRAFVPCQLHIGTTVFCRYAARRIGLCWPRYQPLSSPPVGGNSHTLQRSTEHIIACRPSPLRGNI